jgi:RND family efflux transporter MFP subunit
VKVNRLPLLHKHSAAIAVAVSLAGATLLSRAADDKAASAPSKAALTVNVTTPQLADWPRTLPATGNIAPWQEAIIGSEVGGLRVAELRVGVGDAVKRGQLLARLQSDTVNAEVAQTRANLAEAEATVAEAQANAERARQLQTTGAISAQQINQYLTAEQTARARAQALRARLQADQLRLSHTRVVAPDDGVISARLGAVGQVVQPGQELFRLIRQQRLEWRAEVSAADLARVQPGMPAQVTTASGAMVPGKVRMVAPTVDAQTRNGLVYVDLTGRADAKAGMFARGQFELGHASGLTLPQGAVLLREGFAYVYRVGADNKVVQTKVSLGRRVGDRVEIASGLDRNARVVASGAGFLADGDTVRVVQASSPAASAAGGSGAKAAAAAPAR